MSKADAKTFLEKLEKDPELKKQMKALNIGESVVNLGRQLHLTFTVEELDEAIEAGFKSRCSRFLEGLGFSEVPGF